MWINKLPSRSRAVLLWGIGVFLFVQLGLQFTIERWRPEWSDPEYGYRFRNLKKQIQKDPDRPLLLVLGSSRIGNGFVADNLPPDSYQASKRPLVYNMSLSGGSPLYELLLLKRVLAAGVHPRWILIEILPPFLNWEDKVLASPDPVPPNRIRWSDFDVLDRHAPKSYWHRHCKWLQICLVAWYSNRYSLLSRYATSWLEPDKTFQVRFWRKNLTPCGWLSFPVAQVTPEQYERWLQHARDQYTEKLANFRVSPESDRLFREILSTCRAEKIEVIGILRMPEGTDFRKMYSSEASRTIDSYLKRLCEENETQLIDASHWLPDDCFADSHHLLPHGAEQFTLRLWSDVLEKHIHGPSAVGSAMREAELP
jgi:hypothetical protein